MLTYLFTMAAIFVLSGGGTLSMKKSTSGQYDIYFSYSDRIDEMSAADFCNVVPNFIETSARLKSHLLGCVPRQEEQTSSDSVSNSSTSNGASQPIGLATKFV